MHVCKATLSFYHSQLIILSCKAPRSLNAHPGEVVQSAKNDKVPNRKRSVAVQLVVR